MIVIATLLRKLQAVKDMVRLLSKKHCFRTLLHSQHVKGSQTLVKSAREHFHDVFPSLWETLTSKISPLVIFWILGVFRNTLTANDKYSFQDLENLLSPTQIQLSLKPKHFLIFFLPFLESISNFKQFGKKDDLHSYFFAVIYRLWKTWLIYYLEKSTVSEHPLTVNMIKGPKPL